MSDLKIPLSRVKESGLAIDVSADAESFRPADAKELDAAQIRLRGTLTPAAGQVLFKGRLTGVYRGDCDRCLRAVELPFDFEVLWSFALGVSPVAADNEAPEKDDAAFDAEVIVVKGDEIDLGPLVWEELVLGLPSRFIPNPDDAGKCVECGANLAEPLVWRQPEDSDSSETSSKGLAGLGDLYPGLRPKESEE